MIRVFSFAALILLAFSTRSSFEDSAGHPLIEHRAVATDRATRISDAVRQRFALDAAVAKCRFTENLYAYKALLGHFSGENRHLIEAAAEAGRSTPQPDLVSTGGGEPGDASPKADCTVAIDHLRTADDTLLALSETMERD